MLLPTATHWSILINFIIQNHFSMSVSNCILWHEKFNFELKTNIPTVNFHTQNLTAAFKRDFYNFSAKEQQLEDNGLEYDELVEKITVVIEHTHCESFVVFQEDIPKFARAFRQASVYSSWRSQHTKFLFVYSKDLQQEEYFDDLLFEDQPNILIIEGEYLNTTTFDLKTNKFVGSLRADPASLYIVDHYDALQHTFAWQKKLYADKTRNLQGREVILGIFHYPPQVVVDYELLPQTRDMAPDNPSGKVHLNGVEVRYILAFCEVHNCTVEGDSSEKDDWGSVYPNGTGNGLLGMIVNRQSHMGLGGMASWDTVYAHLDLTTFIGRSGITCMVPSPTRLTSWDLPIRPLQFTLWLGIAGCIMTEIISLLFARYMDLSFTVGSTSWYSSFAFGFNVALRLFISQGVDYVTLSSTLRVMLTACYMIDIILTSIYSGGLASILTLPVLEEPADSFYRLYTHNLPWAGTSEAWIWTIEGETDDPIMMAVVDNFKVMSLESMQELAEKEKMGFVLERLEYGHFGNSEYLTRKSLDRLKLMTDDVYFQFIVAYVPRLWPFLAKFNSLVFDCHSSGLSEIWEYQVTARYLSASVQETIESSAIINIDTEAIALDTANCIGVFLIWLTGIIVSILAFLAELFYYKYHTKKQE